MRYLIFLIISLGAITCFFLIAIHLGFRAPRNREKGNPADFGIDFQQDFIETKSGKRLFSWLLPVAGSNQTIIILHGWGGNAQLMLPLALPFYRAGLNVLLIDARSHGNSDTDTFSSLPRFAEDLGAAVDWLKQSHARYCEKIALLGHSVGAAAVLFEASRRHDIDAVISISAFAHPEWMMQRYLQRFHLPKLLIRLVMRYVEWVIRHPFAAIAPLQTVCRIKAPVLIVHGKDDTTVPIEDARAILSSCPEPHLSLLEVADAGHDSIEKIEQHATDLLLYLDKCGFYVCITP